jgi:hypothetical protein
MFLKSLKHFIKKKFPSLTLILIKIRDNNYFLKKINTLFIKLNK